MVDRNWTTPSRRQILVTGVSAGLTGLAGCFAPGTAVTAETTERYSVPGGTALAVANRNGDVRVEHGDSPDVVVDVVKRTRFDRDFLDRVAIEGSTEENVLTVRPTYESDRTAARVSIKFNVRIPQTVPLARATTENGDVMVEGVGGSATLQTVNGKAEARDVAGYVTLRSNNGDVVAASVAGVDAASTTNGDVDVAVTDLRDDAMLESTNGDVEAALASDLAVTVEARTANGNVEVDGLDFGKGRRSGQMVSGTLNGGGPKLTARTVNGDVVLSAL